MAKIHCDYLSFTAPAEFTEDELDSLCQTIFGLQFAAFTILGKSRSRYADCYVLDENLAGVYTNGYGNNRGTTHFDLPGSGIRKLGIDVFELCKILSKYEFSLCRFDIAVDDTEGKLPFEEMAKFSTGEAFEERVKTRFSKRATVRKDGRRLAVLPTISTQPRRIQYGSEKSDNYIVVYDKEYCAGVAYPWMRVELRMCNRRDLEAFLKALLKSENKPAYMAGVLRGKLDYLNLDNAKKERRSTVQWWLDFLSNPTTEKLDRVSIIPIHDVCLDVKRVMKILHRMNARGNKEGLSDVLNFGQSLLAA